VKVFIIAAMSADGFIGLDAGHRSLDWRSKEDAKFFIQTTKEAGVIVMGSVTYNTFRIKQAPPGRRLIVYTSRPNSVRGERVETTKEKPLALIRRLKREGANAVAIGGGATINKLFLDSGLVDEIYLTLEPVLFGRGVPLLKGEVSQRLSLLDFKKLGGDTVLLHYAVKRS
jgi:dihydrofolate reductase